MRVYENGKYRDMTAEEIAEMERAAADMSAQTATVEEQVLELREAIDLLLSGVTE